MLGQNPEWTSSVAAGEFRPVAPGSQPEYRPPEIKRFDPKEFHYYPRDTRRAAPPVVIIENPEFKGLLTQGQTKPISSGPEEIVQSAESAAELGMKPPTRKYEYRVALKQPEATGYFTITNYT